MISEVLDKFINRKSYQLSGGEKRKLGLICVLLGNPDFVILDEPTANIDVEGTTYPIGGDVILAVDGIEVRKIDDILIHLQRAKSVGDEMVLEILRDGRTTNVTIVLQERPNGN